MPFAWKVDDCAFFFCVSVSSSFRRRVCACVREYGLTRDVVMTTAVDARARASVVSSVVDDDDAEIRRVRRRGQDHDAAEEYADAAETIVGEKVRR